MCDDDADDVVNDAPRFTTGRCITCMLRFNSVDVNEDEDDEDEDDNDVGGARVDVDAEACVAACAS